MTERDKSRRRPRMEGTFHPGVKESVDFFIEDYKKYTGEKITKSDIFEVALLEFFEKRRYPLTQVIEDEDRARIKDFKRK